MAAPRVLILIPARYASQRFPGKPLVKISKKSLIQRVYENCSQSPWQDQGLWKACVVTDDDRIEAHLKEIGAEVCRVDDDVPSGTLRIALAYERFFKDFNPDVIVNVQGDEPLLDSGEIARLAQFHHQSSFDMATMVKPMKGFDQEFRDPSRVKAVFSPSSGQCLYFSRAPIPHCRDNPQNSQGKWHLHIGLYSFRPKSLESFGKYKQGYYEDIEKLEQLRALENGLSIGAIETTQTLFGVDTPEDIKKVEGVLSGKGI